MIANTQQDIVRFIPQVRSTPFGNCRIDIGGIKLRAQTMCVGGFFAEVRLSDGSTMSVKSKQVLPDPTPVFAPEPLELVAA